MVYTRVKKGAVQEVVGRNGKVRAVNHDRGVKHCLVRDQFGRQKVEFSCRQVVASVPGVRETHHNFQILFNLLNLHNQQQCKLVVDLKAANLSLGMQSARARYRIHMFSSGHTMCSAHCAVYEVMD